MTLLQEYLNRIYLKTTFVQAVSAQYNCKHAKTT